MLFLFLTVLINASDSSAASSGAASPQSRFTVTELGYIPLVARSESVANETQVYFPATTSSLRDDSALEPAINPRIRRSLKKFLSLKEEAQHYEGRELSKLESKLLSNDFLQKVLESDPRTAIDTLTDALPLLNQIIFRERNNDIDYLVQNLQELSTLSTYERLTIAQAAESRDLTTLEQLRLAHTVAAFSPTASPSKSCIKKHEGDSADSGTETPPVSSGHKKSISFSPFLDDPDMIDLSSPRPTTGELHGSFSLLFGNDDSGK